ncbi:9984_t:CDS:2 [Cetraspora pellucida]|uniref:9984_t:CDS:1 n=1 Tax=Cetraspora pellucida TaxID=1433469 RepID=A0A9N9B8P4_9GLOM|nr:9984_t:CDS:2 [Cetraspora pellucida]
MKHSSEWINDDEYDEQNLDFDIIFDNPHLIRLYNDFEKNQRFNNCCGDEYSNDKRNKQSQKIYAKKSRKVTTEYMYKYLTQSSENIN